MQQLSPLEIEAESFRIIEREAGDHGFEPDAWQVVRRMIHATADFSFLKTIRFSPGALNAAARALVRGCTVYADTQMLAAALSRPELERRGCELLCCVADQDVCDQSRRTGQTRSALAMRKAAALMSGGIVVIGNAPTALHEAVTLCEQGLLRPELVIGLPVGFVEALESKQRLHASAVACITNLDRKGGTPAAAAAMNALLRLGER